MKKNLKSIYVRIYSNSKNFADWYKIIWVLEKGFKVMNIGIIGLGSMGLNLARNFITKKL